MTNETLIQVDSYTLKADRYYDSDTHLWVQTSPEGGPVRCGFDPLGSETSGDIVAVSFEPVGTEIRRGESFGSLEAAKFVGPLVAPVSGTIRAHNTEVLARPDLVTQDPMTHWFVEIELDAGESDLVLLLRDPELVRVWFELEVQKFQEKGMIAE